MALPRATTPGSLFRLLLIALEPGSRIFSLAQPQRVTPSSTRPGS
jgi:hypothetical protein